MIMLNVDDKNFLIHGLYLYVMTGIEISMP